MTKKNSEQGNKQFTPLRASYSRSVYVKFLGEEASEWQDKTSSEQLPIVLFVCPRTSDLIYAKRRTRKLIADAWYWEDDDAGRPRVRFTTGEATSEWILG